MKENGEQHGSQEMSAEERRRQLAELMRGLDISDVINVYIKSGHGYSRRILRFFKWFSKWVPMGIMLCHAYGVTEFSQHPREMFVLLEGNDACYCFIYAMVYLLPMVMILSSRFFWLCWRYRIPFFYYIGVNAIHIGYRSLFTTNAMVMSHVCLFIMIGCFYLYGFSDMFFQSRIGRKIFR